MDQLYPITCTGCNNRDWSWCCDCPRTDIGESAPKRQRISPLPVADCDRSPPLADCLAHPSRFQDVPDAIVMTILNLAIDNAEDYTALVFVSKRTHSLLRSTGCSDHLKQRLRENIRRAQQVLDDHQLNEAVQWSRRAQLALALHIFGSTNMPLPFTSSESDADLQ